MGENVQASTLLDTTATTQSPGPVRSQPNVMVHLEDHPDWLAYSVEPHPPEKRDE